MAEDCVVELCRQPALPMPVTVEIGNARLELPLCAIHAETVSAEIFWVQEREREESWVDD